MGNLELLVRLTEVLVERRVLPTDIDEFSRHWLAIEQHADIPCPSCFLGAGSGALTALHTGGRVALFECKGCGEVFNLRQPGPVRV